MAAGLGFKDFTTGEVLTAADVDGYLMQGIWVFANATARDAAVTAPAEGNFAFTKDNNSLWYYDGAAWVASGATGDIEGVTAGVGISGGGTSGTVTVTNSMATAIDAKGDLVVGTGADTFARLAVGTNGHTLVADSSESTGLKWAAPAGGATSYALLNAGGTSLTSGTTTISSLSGYNKLFVVMVDSASFTSTGQTLLIRFNSDSTSNYRYGINKIAGYTSWASSNVFVGTYNTTTEIQAADNSTNANSIFAGFMAIDGANSSGIKMFNWSFGVSAAGGEGNVNYTGGGNYLGSSVISSISFICPSGTWDAGTVYIYGAN